MAFRGAFDYTLDAKNRLTIPARFRAALSDGVVLAKGVERCVAVWRASDYDSAIEGALQGLNPMSPKARQLERFFSMNAVDLELDAAGRVAIPQKLREHAGLDREVVVSGAGRCLELWDRDRWQAYDASLDDEISDLTASLGHHPA